MRRLILLLLLVASPPLFASGPYTAFTFGATPPGPMTITRVEHLLFGMSVGNAVYPVPIGQQLSTGTVGLSYSESFLSSGGTAPFTYNLIDPGNLPPGLLFSGASITGNPTSAGTYTFHLKVTDANGNSNTEAFTIVVVAPSLGGGNSGFVS